MATASGSFEIQITREPPFDEAEGITLGRAHIAKKYFGELEGTSKGEMTSVRSSVASSAGYVAVERITCTLGGKRGSFVLQHSGIMNRGAGTLVCGVVPDTATGELVGLSGTMRIDPSGPKHEYVFDYQL